MGRESRAYQGIDEKRVQAGAERLLMACCSILNRGFFGRMKWLLLGR